LRQSPIARHSHLRNISMSNHSGAIFAACVTSDVNRATRASSDTDRRVATPCGAKRRLAISLNDASAPHHIRSNMHIICAYTLRAFCPAEGSAVSLSQSRLTQKACSGSSQKTLVRFLLILWLIGVDRYESVVDRGGCDPVHVLLHPRPQVRGLLQYQRQRSALGRCTTSADMPPDWFSMVEALP
jgi:hypothetical protein